MNVRHLAAVATTGVAATTAGAAASLAFDDVTARRITWVAVAATTAILLGIAYGRRIPAATIVRAALTYTLAGLAAAVAATIATVPLGPASPPAVTAVWLAAAAPVGFSAVLLCDRITFHRTTSNGDRA